MSVERPDAREAGRLIIEPMRSKSLLALLATLDPIDEALPAIHDSLPDPVIVRPKSAPPDWHRPR